MNRLRRTSATLLSLCSFVLGSCTQDQIDQFELAGQTDGSVSVSTQALTDFVVAPSADTQVSSLFQNANGGTSPIIGVTSWSVADIKRTIIKFDQAQILAATHPPNVLWRARLELTAVGFSAGTSAWMGGGIDISRMTRTWGEGAATWRCSNDSNTTNANEDCLIANKWSMTPGGANPLAYAPIATARSPVYTGGPTKISFDVTNDVQAWINSGNNFGWMIAGAANLTGGEWINFASKEASNAANRPKLIIDYGMDQCANPNKGAPGVCGCDILDVDTNSDRVPDCFDATVVASADTVIRLATPFLNDGQGQYLGSTSASIVGLERSLVKFDTAAINAVRGSRGIHRAYVDLTVASIAVDWLGGQVQLSRMKHNWGEGTGLNGSFPNGGATWWCSNDLDTTVFGVSPFDCAPGNAWGMQIIDINPLPFVPTVTARADINWPNTTTVRFDVTEDVIEMLKDTVGFSHPNFGWIIQGSPSIASGSYINFASRETSTPPRLVLDLDPPCPPGADGDDDGDNVMDCYDACLEDNKKSQPGICGCGVPDVDTDGDKIMNCQDPCPNDNDPTLGGECGCPSGTGALAKKPAGTLCNGVCGGKGNTNKSGIDKCDANGRCGTPASCEPIPGVGCKAYKTKVASYWYCPTNRTPAQVATACSTVPGMAMAPIANAKQNATVKSLITGDTWTAATDSFAEGAWRWSPNNKTTIFWDGTSTGKRHGGAYANWRPTQPAAGTAASDDCGAMIAAGASAGMWEARSCGDSRHVLCMRHELGEAPIRDQHSGPENTLTTCEIMGNCPKPIGTGPNQSGACVPENTVPGLCAPGTIGCPAQVTAEADLRRCDTCMKANPVCLVQNPTAAQITQCRNLCNNPASAATNRCTGTALPPPATSTCEPMDNYAAARPASNPPYPIQPEATKRCTLKSLNKNALCITHGWCAANFGANNHCGYSFFCKKANGTRGVACAPEFPAGAAIPTTATGGRAATGCAADEECTADLFCGVPADTCFLNATSEMCREYDMCLDPSNEIGSRMPDADVTNLNNPTPLDPVASFPVTEPALVSTGNWPADGPCRTAGCGIPQTYNPANLHKWCTLEPDGRLNMRDTDPVNKSGNPSGNGGPGKSLSFKFDPKLNLDFVMANGPLGIPLPYVGANAAMKATATVGIFNLPNVSIDVIDLSLDAHGGLKMANLRQDPVPSTTTDLCGVKVTSKAKILKIDVMPDAYKNYALPETNTQAECLRIIRRYTDAADRARKAYADAREVLTQYRAAVNPPAPALPKNFGNGISVGGAPPVKSLCEVIGLLSPPGPKSGDLVFPGGLGDCKTEIPELTVNRLIHYANYTTQKALRDAISEVTDGLDDLIRLEGVLLEIPVVNEHEEITIFNQTFMIGPVPVNLEVLMPVTYGVNGTLDYQVKIGTALNQLLLAQDGDPTAPIARIGATGRPYAGAGISLFAGVGFDIGFAAAKIGIEGAIDLGRIEIPTGGWAGVGISSVKDARTPSAAQVPFIAGGATAEPMIPARKINFQLLYGYDLGIKIDHVLDGELNGKLKLKFFWFSITYRQRIIKFNGFCRTDGGSDAVRKKREDWCDTQLLTGGGELDTGWEWGAIQSPFAFFQLPYLNSVVNAPQTATYSKTNAGTLFYDSMCQCVPEWDFTKPASENTAKVCYRNEDCCPGAGTCNWSGREDGGGTCWTILE